MSILIKGMEMPKSCYKCPLRRRDGMDIVCPVAHERFSVADVNILDYRLDNCPLVPVPPHGRLIDADVLDASLKEMSEIEWNQKAFPVSWAYAFDAFRDIIERDEPTVISAEESE